MTEDSKWNDLKNLIQETQDNLRKVDLQSSIPSKNEFGIDYLSASSKREFGHGHNSSSIPLLREENNFITAAQPWLVARNKTTGPSGEVVEYFSNCLAQSTDERNYITRLLVEMKDDMKKMLHLTDSEQRKLDYLRTDNFIREQERNLSRENSLIAEKVQHLIDQTDQLHRQNEIILKKLDESRNDTSNKFTELSQRNDIEPILKELKDIISMSSHTKTMTSNRNFKNEKELSFLYDDVRPSKPRQLDTTSTPTWRFAKQDSFDGSFGYKTTNQLRHKYLENKRQLKLLEEERFTSPNFLYTGSHTDRVKYDGDTTEKSTWRKRKGKKTVRIAETDCSTDADITTEDLN